MKVIGVVGKNGSGKDEVVRYLNKQYGIPLFSVGDVVRDIAKEEEIEPTRDNLDEITRKYFAKYGKGYFLKQTIEKIINNGLKSAGISGIRSPEDVNILRESFKDDFILIYVYITDDRVRFERMLKRGSARDNMTFDELLKQDQASEEIFNVSRVIDTANLSISNDGTLEDMHREIDKTVDRLHLI
jgi:dephospho-CoA kinase